MIKKSLYLCAFLAAICLPGLLIAQDAAQAEVATVALETAVKATTALDSGNTAWMLTATALVLWSIVVTFIIVMICKFTTGLRVTEDVENTGLDQSEHGETAYQFE